MTAAPVPDGTLGELVFSSRDPGGLPLLRYRTGDIAALRRDPCPCGRTLVRMSQITGRRDDMLVIRGVNVYPSEVERVLLGAPVGQPRLPAGGGRAREMRRSWWRCASTAPPVAGPAGREEELETRLRAELGVRVQVRVLPAGTVPRTEVGKAVRVVRWATASRRCPAWAESMPGRPWWPRVTS